MYFIKILQFHVLLLLLHTWAVMLMARLMNLLNWYSIIVVLFIILNYDEFTYTFLPMDAWIILQAVFLC